MFNDSKYTRIYNTIIERAAGLGRSKKDGYFERHHIIPKSLGGGNNMENLVLLTPREHYVCHRLLVKMVHGKSRAKMYSALMYLQNKHQHLGFGYYSSNAYARARQACRLPKELHPRFGKKVSEKQLARMKAQSGQSGLFYGRRHTSETKAKMSASKTGRFCGEQNPMFGKTHSEETKARLSELAKGENNPFYGKRHTGDFAKRNRGATHAMYGKKHSEETRAKIRAAVKGKQDGARNHRFGKSPSDEQRQAQREFMAGRKFVSRDGETRVVSKTDLDALLKEGWRLGRAK